MIGQPIVAAFAAERLYPSVPFVGLAEGMVIAAFREAGVSLQHIRKAVAVLKREMKIDHALASERLDTDGASILFDDARNGDEELLTHAVTQQRVFGEIVREYLRSSLS